MPRFGRLKRVTRLSCWLTAMLSAALAFGQHYTQTDLTADVRTTSATAANLDPNLVNAWGLARNSSSFWWISDNGTGRATLVDGTGSPQSLVVTIPAPNGSGTSAPTGAVFNFTTAFAVKGSPSLFLFVTEDGTIAGWNAAAGTTAVLAVNASSRNAVFKGCAIARTKQGPRFFATNFTTGTVEVWDGNFRRLPTSQQAFRVPGAAANFAPFNIQNVGGNLVVTFAFRQPGSKDEQHGAGLGIVAIFDTAGRLIRVLQRGAFLNAPWGVVLAPSDFGAFSHRLLIGNFGDGTIHAFNVFTGAFEGTLLGSNSQSLRIDGLWSLQVGNDQRAGSAQAVFFTAGPNDEMNGLFGKLTPVANETRGSTE